MSCGVCASRSSSSAEPADTTERIIDAVQGRRWHSTSTDSTSTSTRRSREKVFREDWEETRRPNDYVLTLEGDRPGIGKAKQSEGHWRFVFPTVVFRHADRESTVPGWCDYEEYENAMEYVMRGSTDEHRHDPSPDEYFEAWPTATARELAMVCGDEAAVPDSVVTHDWGEGSVLPHANGSVRPRPVNLLSVGAGAVGGTIAARLSRSGVDLTVVDADAAHVALLGDPGLIVERSGRRPTDPAGRRDHPAGRRAGRDPARRSLARDRGGGRVPRVGDRSDVRCRVTAERLERRSHRRDRRCRPDDRVRRRVRRDVDRAGPRRAELGWAIS